MLKLIVKKDHPSTVTQCYMCEEMHSITCDSCDINMSTSYICPTCKRVVNVSKTMLMPLNYRIICGDCMRNIHDVISISRAEKARVLYHLGNLD